MKSIFQQEYEVRDGYYVVSKDGKSRYDDGKLWARKKQSCKSHFCLGCLPKTLSCTNSYQLQCPPFIPSLAPFPPSHALFFYIVNADVGREAALRCGSGPERGLVRGGRQGPPGLRQQRARQGLPGPQGAIFIPRDTYRQVPAQAPASRARGARRAGGTGAARGMAGRR